MWAGLIRSARRPPTSERPRFGCSGTGGQVSPPMTGAPAFGGPGDDLSARANRSPLPPWPPGPLDSPVGSAPPALPPPALPGSIDPRFVLESGRVSPCETALTACVGPARVAPKSAPNRGTSGLPSPHPRGSGAVRASTRPGTMSVVHGERDLTSSGHGVCTALKPSRSRWAR